MTFDGDFLTVFLTILAAEAVVELVRGFGGAWLAEWRKRRLMAEQIKATVELVEKLKKLSAAKLHFVVRDVPPIVSSDPDREH